MDHRTQSGPILALRASGLLGIACAALVFGWLLLAEDAVIDLPSLASDEATTLAVATLLIGSILALIYVDFLPSIPSWSDVISIIFLASQWGTPLAIYLGSGHQFSVYDFLTVVGVLLHAIVAVVLLIGWIRLSWSG